MIAWGYMTFRNFSRYDTYESELVQNEKARFGILALGLIFFGFSMFWSVIEMRYVAFGRVAPGQVERVNHISIPTRHGSSKSLRVEYPYTDAETTEHRGVQRLRANAPYQEGQAISVQYIPTSGPAHPNRIRGEGNLWAIWVTLGAVVLAVLGIVRLAREANEPFRPRAVARRRRRVSA